jgi:hypothetical protein
MERERATRTATDLLEQRVALDLVDADAVQRRLAQHAHVEIRVAQPVHSCRIGREGQEKRKTLSLRHCDAMAPIVLQDNRCTRKNASQPARQKRAQCETARNRNRTRRQKTQRTLTLFDVCDAAHDDFGVEVVGQPRYILRIERRRTRARVSTESGARMRMKQRSDRPDSRRAAAR